MLSAHALSVLFFWFWWLSFYSGSSWIVIQVRFASYRLLGILCFSCFEWFCLLNARVYLWLCHLYELRLCEWFFCMNSATAGLCFLLFIFGLFWVYCGSLGIGHFLSSVSAVLPGILCWTVRLFGFLGLVCSCSICVLALPCALLHVASVALSEHGVHVSAGQGWWYLMLRFCVVATKTYFSSPYYGFLWWFPVLGAAYFFSFFLIFFFFNVFFVSFFLGFFLFFSGLVCISLPFLLFVVGGHCFGASCRSICEWVWHSASLAGDFLIKH